MQTAKKKTVRRRHTAVGAALPTAKELALLHELAARWRLGLPEGCESDLRLVRAVLDAFALSPSNSFEQILRRLRNARPLAWDGLGGGEIAIKLELPECLRSVLHA